MVIKILLPIKIIILTVKFMITIYNCLFFAYETKKNTPD